MPSNKYKIIILTDTTVGVPGGSERHLYNFLNNISDNFTVKVYQLSPNRNTFLNDGFSLGENIEIISHPLEKIASFSALKLTARLFSDFISFKPDIVVSYHEKSDIINYVTSLIPFMKHKIVSSKRDMGLKLDGRLGKIIRYITPRFDAVTSPSKMVTDLFVNNFGAKPESSFVIHNGADLLNYRQVQLPDRKNLKLELGVNPKRKTIISVGWLRKGKGHDFLIKSLAEFDSNDEWQVVILGEGPEEANLRVLIASLGLEEKVYMPGMQVNVNEWLSASDIAVSASFSEGLSNALIEACASSLPIVATNVGGNPEIVEDGVNGFLIEKGSSKELTDAIKRLVSSEIDMLKMSKESRRIAESKFSIPKMVMELEMLYMNMVKP